MGTTLPVPSSTDTVKAALLIGLRDVNVIDTVFGVDTVVVHSSAVVATNTTVLGVVGVVWVVVGVSSEQPTNSETRTREASAKRFMGTPLIKVVKRLLSYFPNQPH